MNQKIIIIICLCSVVVWVGMMGLASTIVYASHYALFDEFCEKHTEDKMTAAYFICKAEIFQMKEDIDSNNKTILSLNNTVNQLTVRIDELTALTRINPPIVIDTVGTLTCSDNTKYDNIVMGWNRGFIMKDPKIEKTTTIFKVNVINSDYHAMVLSLFSLQSNSANFNAEFLAFNGFDSTQRKQFCGVTDTFDFNISGNCDGTNFVAKADNGIVFNPTSLRISCQK